MALVFPEKEKFALSTLGWQVVYRLLAGSADFAVERFYADDGITPPVSADSGRELSDFPLICFSLNFEGDFVTALSLLRRADIPLAADDRRDWPLVMAGGPIAFLNPFPIFPALDLLFVGEAEHGFLDMAHAIKDLWFSGVSREEAVSRLGERPGVLAHGQEDGVIPRSQLMK